MIEKTNKLRSDLSPEQREKAEKIGATAAAVIRAWLARENFESLDLELTNGL